MHGDQHVMTVADLIKHLQQFPPDAEVIYRACSDWWPMTDDEVTLVRAEDRKIVYRLANGYSNFNPAYLPKGANPDDQDFRTCVLFPGN